MEKALKARDQIVGFIDIGTNSVRLLVVRINPNSSYTVISQEKEVVRLGEQEFKDNILKPYAMERTLWVCRKFADLARTYGAATIVAVGTAAIREALNKTEFLQQLAAQGGISVHVISGKEEARLTYLGVSSGVDIGYENAIFIDLGGGSTEIGIGNQFKCVYLDSLALGAVRLTTQSVGEGWTGTIHKKVYERMKRHVIIELRKTTDNVKQFKAKLAYGSSGTIINLAEITNRMFKNGENSKNLLLLRRSLKKMIPILCDSSLEERRKIPGLNHDRADIIVAGAVIIETIMNEFELEELHVSQRGLRDGLLIDYLSQQKNFKDFQTTPMRNRSVFQLGRSCNFDERHAEVVASLATQLFDSAYQAKLHDLGDDCRELLRYAALLHDVGDFLSFNDHHLHSHYIISNTELLGFDQREITMMANLARFHRKKIPSKKTLKSVDLDEKSKKTVMILSAFLRLAEKLDRGHCGLVKKAEFTKVDKNRVVLSLFSYDECSLEEWSVIQNASAFNVAFGKRIEVRCEKLPDTELEFQANMDNPLEK